MVSESSRFLWLGNQPALDFVNTELMRRGERTDLLSDLDSLVSWLVEARLLPRTTATSALDRWQSSREAARVLEKARRLRAAIRTVTEQVTLGKRASQPALDEINAVLGLGASHTRIVRTSAGFERRLELHLEQSAQLLQPIAAAAAALFCDTDPGLIKRCSNHACILYFHDISKNHARRWCSMDLCGNRTKVAAHYQRRRSEQDFEGDVGPRG
jgi:predicted RNA-binding Zn ribbon-like protein